MLTTKNANPTSLSSKDIRSWVLAARPKTWTASLAPVCIGNFLAGNVPFRFLPLVFALLLQIGSNFANDYFDFMKGADTKERQGPKRALLEGWISKKAMRWGMGIVFGLAFLCAIPLMQIAGIWALVATVVAIACAIFYTAGPKPLGYLGLGEVVVFAFFGPIAVLGTYYLQTLSWSALALAWSVPPGLLSAAILLANNLRDYPTDKKAGKHTIVVRFGLELGKKLWVAMMGLALAIPTWIVFTWNQSLWYALPSLLIFMAIPLMRQCIKAETPGAFIPLLPATSLLLLLYTLLFCSTHALPVH